MGGGSYSAPEARVSELFAQGVICESQRIPDLQREQLGGTWTEG